MQILDWVCCRGTSSGRGGNEAVAQPAPAGNAVVLTCTGVERQHGRRAHDAIRRAVHQAKGVRGGIREFRGVHIAESTIKVVVIGTMDVNLLQEHLRSKLGCSVTVVPRPPEVPAGQGQQRAAGQAGQPAAGQGRKPAATLVRQSSTTLVGYANVPPATPS